MRFIKLLIKTAAVLLLGSIVLGIVISLMASPGDQPQKRESVGTDACALHVELLSARQWADELGTTESAALASHRIRLWEKPSHLGKGQPVGSMRPGSRALVIDYQEDDYQVRSPLDGSIGWISSTHVDRELMQDTATRMPCGDETEESVEVITCPDGSIYMGNNPDEACR